MVSEIFTTAIVYQFRPTHGKHQGLVRTPFQKISSSLPIIQTVYLFSVSLD
jgi:hypothetical protein